MKLIEWINGVTKLNKKTMDEFQNNVSDAINNIPSGMPVGAGCDFYGITPPEGYMFADGSEISRTDYAELFEMIGEIYGAGDGETTFNLPDKRERVSVMYKEGSTNGTEGATLGTLGAVGGEFKHKQTVDELAKHTHTQNAHKHSATTSGSWNQGATMRMKGEESNSTHTVSNATDSTTATNQDTGKSTPMNIMQPYLVCNYIIKVK